MDGRPANNPLPTWRVGAALGTLICVAALSLSSIAAETQPQPHCVELPDGTYSAQDGLLQPIAEPSGGSLEDELQRVQQLLPRLGYDWLTLHLSDDVLLVQGTALSQSDREKAFAASIALIRSNPRLNQSIRVIADQMELAAGTPVLQTPTETLIQQEKLETCQADLSAALSQGGVAFNAEGVRLTPRSQTVLDEVAKIAQRCEAYDLDIAGRAEQSGSEGFQTVLSSARAEEVRRYLEARGIGSERLSVIAYGLQLEADEEGERLTPYEARRVEIAFTMR